MLPLARSPVLRSTDRDEAFSSIRLRHPGLRRVDSPSRRNGVWSIAINGAGIGDIGISGAQTSACDYAMAPDGLVRVFVPLQRVVDLTIRGVARAVTAGQCVFGSVTEEIACSFGDGFAGIFVTCPADSLSRALQSLHPDVPLAGSLDRLCAQPNANWTLFRAQLFSTIAMLDEGPDLLLKQAVFMDAHQELLRFHLANVILSAGRDAGRESCHSRYTRRAVACIEANPAGPIGLEALAGQAGCSIRTLQASFAADLGTTITGYVREIRLRNARSLLQAAAPGSTVSGIALDCGFTHLGEFARAYAARYRERPSSTLAAGRLRPHLH